MMGGKPSWWSMHPPSQQPSALLSSSPSFLPPPQYLLGSSSLPFSSLPDNNQELPHQSWSQLLMGGFPGYEDRLALSQFHSKKLENWEDLNPRVTVVSDVKQEVSQYRNLYGVHVDEEFLAPHSRPGWSSATMLVSSPRSCVTSLSNNILDFAYNNKADGKHQHPDQSSECDSTATGGVCKKARVLQPSSSQPPLKVRKEKLGDRITALHQLVSPFGKTDTASVLLEAIGYIRFLQGQIEALSSPYMGTPSSKMGNQQSHVQDNPKDLRSRGLCLVPVSCTQHVGSENGADYWASAMDREF
ncbi:hypothetical protein K2173_024710 [Erythroxylum novogranatense]|uniref:BHLH domain-containing protein n=1 Tax=Erythroxylum novogranatense TaxID=1862640 RepID=A0AAV8SVC8_9ROSI|nr:hypothetical protein K2173_024710 [Erythroxylum novogranatense]